LKNEIRFWLRIQACNKTSNTRNQGSEGDGQFHSSMFCKTLQTRKWALIAAIDTLLAPGYSLVRLELIAGLRLVYVETNRWLVNGYGETVVQWQLFCISFTVKNA
jgi:hypothetical protein